MAYWLAFPQPADIRVVETTQLTHDREPKLREPLFTDGQRVFYRNEGPQPRVRVGSRWRSSPVFQEPTRYFLLDVSRVRPEYLVLRLGEADRPDEVWVIPAGRRRSATDSVDRLQVGGLVPGWRADRLCEPSGAVDRGQRRHESNATTRPGARRRRVATLVSGWCTSALYVQHDGRPGRSGESLWEVRADGRDLTPFLPGWNGGVEKCCGNWDPSGRYFFFEAVREGRRDLWVLPEPRGLFRWPKHRFASRTGR